MTEIAEKPTAARGPNGRFLPGNSGRPKGLKNADHILTIALEAARKHRERLKEPCACVPEHLLKSATPQEIWDQSCQTIDEHFARRAFLNDKVLIAFQNKRIPDLVHQTGGQPTSITIVYGHANGQPRTIITQPLAESHVNGD